MLRRQLVHTVLYGLLQLSHCTSSFSCGASYVLPGSNKSDRAICGKKQFALQEISVDDFFKESLQTTEAKRVSRKYF